LFPKVLVSDLEKFPIANVADGNKVRLLIILVALILYAKSENNNFTFILLDKIIDGLVFELYFPDHMKEKEINILKFVEQDLKEVSGEDDFEQLPDEKKENVIEELHKRWSNPASEIVKRMNSFAEKSPDILKPILESN